MAQQQLTSFLKTFQALEVKVEKSLEEQNLNTATEELQKLSRVLSEHASSLPSYELRKAQSQVTKFQSKLIELEEATRPKRKFKFNRKVNSEQPKAVDSSSKTIISTDQPDSLSKTSLEPTLSSLTGQQIILESDQVNNKDLWLDNLQNCSVTIVGIPSTIHMTKLVDCKIIGGPVLTSIFLENCLRSCFVLGCQQLRTHKSRDCDFYLHVRSRAIIEDCSNCRFAPYNRQYASKESDFAAAQLDGQVNHWNQVDDFNWLSTEKPSPNWSILPENERIQN